MTVRIAAIAALAALVTAALGAVAVLLFAGAPASRSDGNPLERSFSAHATFQQERFQRLELASRLLAEDRVLIAATGAAEPDAAEAPDSEGETDPAELAGLLRRRLSRLGCDLALLVNADGSVLARSDSSGAAASRTGGSAAGSQPIGGPTASPAAAVWQEEGRLYYAARAPMAPDFRYSAVAALAVDDLLALEIERAGGAEVAFFAASGVGPQLVGSSDPARAGALLGQLAAPGGQLERVFAGRGPIPDTEFGSGAASYRGRLAALDDAAGQPVGAIVLFSPTVAAGGSRRLPLLVALAVGALLASLLVIPLALASARRSAGPVARLAESVDAVRAGDPSQRISRSAAGGPARASALAPLAASLDRLFGDLHERQSLAAVAAAAARTAPRDSRPGDATAAGGEAGEPGTGRLTLVAADLRRFATPTEDAAAETVDRWRRDVRRFAAAAAAHDGRFEGALGHRALASFAGDDADRRALAAAAKALVALAEPDNAFDEGEPPALALAAGRVCHGRLRLAGERDGERGVVAGAVVQLLESLLREAQPGELALSPPLARGLAAVCERAGAPPVERPGLLSPRPVPILDRAAAGRLAQQVTTGGDETRVELGLAHHVARESVERVSEPFSELAESAAAGDGADPLALAAGDTVDGRFEVIDVLAASAAGALLSARDRELGERVALEVLAGAAVADPGAFERLDSPLQTVRRLDHPSIARIYDYGRAGNLVFFAREPVGGTSLARLFESPGRLPAPAALGLARQLALAVGSAHRDGVAHGRLRAENVVVGLDGRARITDFGVAMAVRDDPALAASPGLAPEGGATPAGDVYAVAALTVRALTGAWPQGGEALPGGLPERLEPVLSAALAREPARRPANGDELARALDPVFA